LRLLILKDELSFAISSILSLHFDLPFSRLLIENPGATVEIESPLAGTSWLKTGIAWSTDLDKLFVNRPLRSTETQLSPRGFVMPAVDDEEFVVWMKAAALPSFTKLYRQIKGRRLPKGSVLKVHVKNTFPVWYWDGKKSIVLSTVSHLGGSDYLGEIHVIMGAFSLVLAIFFKVITSGKAYAEKAQADPTILAPVEMTELADPKAATSS